MKLSSILTKEINSYDSIEPNVLIFVGESALFWVTKDGYYIWLQEHSGIKSGEFVNENHKIEDIGYTTKNVEGVGNKGVYWMNQDFESPFHISDFTNRIEQINTII